MLRVTVFAPDDLELVKGGPGERRRYLDDALVASHPRYDALRSDVDKILKQRNALLKGSGGRLDESAAFTLDVWDAKLAESGGAPGRGPPGAARPARAGAVGAPTTPWPTAGRDHRHLRRRVGRRGPGEALVATRKDDLRRGVSTVGPHRDDVDLRLAGLPSPHARVPGRAAIARAGAAPGVAPRHHRRHRQRPRCCCSTTCSPSSTPTAATPSSPTSPPGQTLLTSASGLPPKAAPDLVLHITDGRIARG